MCPRYTARVIRGVKVGPSPEWLQRRLIAIGQIPRNNVVDATNSSNSTMIFSSIAPGTAGFLSSLIFTPLTSAFGNETTEFRFLFVGLVSLAVAVLVFINTTRRARKRSASVPA